MSLKYLYAWSENIEEGFVCGKLELMQPFFLFFFKAV